MQWADELGRYVRAPHGYWPPDNPLQANKLRARCTERCEDGDDLEQVIAQIVDAAARRIANAQPTLFLVNCGSSGSHWLEAMLSALPGMRACGEVYVPAPIAETLKSLPEPQSACFLDGLHQLHSWEPAPVGDDDILINSAHSWSCSDLAGTTARTALLIRDPLDVAVSRTFRKPQLRRHLMPDAHDESYLERNIAFVEKFYRSALRRKPATIVRYEDIVARPNESLAVLADMVGRSATPARCAQIAARYSASGQQASGSRLSNVFRGPRVTIPPALEAHAAARLAGLRAEMGYV